MGKYTSQNIGETYGSGMSVDFHTAIEELETDIKKDLESSLIKAFNEMVDGTPVDTGYAKSGWIVEGRGSPSGYLPEASTREEKSYVARDPEEIKRSAEGKIKSMNRAKKGLVDFRFVNNVEYIPLLELGYSSQNQRWIAVAASRIAAAYGTYSRKMKSRLRKRK